MPGYRCEFVFGYGRAGRRDPPAAKPALFTCRHTHRRLAVSHPDRGPTVASLPRRRAARAHEDHSSPYRAASVYMSECM